MKHKFLVKAEWDQEAGVWYVAESDIPGLCTEAATLDHLVTRVLAIAPALLELNANLLEDEDFDADLIDVCIMSRVKVDSHHAR